MINVAAIGFCISE